MKKYFLIGLIWVSTVILLLAGVQGLDSKETLGVAAMLTVVIIIMA